MKHTKGPWKVDKNGAICLVEYAKSIAMVNSVFIPKEEFEANAKLIAAAPQLLEALQEFVNAVYSGCSKEELDMLRKKGEEAIKAATE